jgi:hypothetical protein
MLAGCLLSGCDEGLPPGGDLALRPRDLAVPRDLAGRDLPAPIDAPFDAPLEDAAAFDAAGADLSGCATGYLNSDAGDACPLGCSPAVEKVPDEGNMHVAFGTPVQYQHNPPASGPHWPIPQAWGVYTGVVPREWWVHNLEHGGIVLLYNCPRPDDGGASNDGGQPPDACPNEIAAMGQLYAQQPPVDYYDTISETKMLVTPDPLLPTRFAAVAWDWDWTSDTFDLAAVKCFIDARYNRGPEPAP